MNRQEKITRAAKAYIKDITTDIPATLQVMFIKGAEWADRNPQSHWHDAQGDDLPEDRQHCLIHYGGTKYCDFELAFFNAVDECFVTCSYPHPTGQSVISPGCDNDVLTDVYKNKRDKVSIKEIERWCVLEDILPK